MKLRVTTIEIELDEPGAPKPPMKSDIVREVGAKLGLEVVELGKLTEKERKFVEEHERLHALYDYKEWETWAEAVNSVLDEQARPSPVTPGSKR